MSPGQVPHSGQRAAMGASRTSSSSISRSRIGSSRSSIGGGCGGGRSLQRLPTAASPHLARPAAAQASSASTSGGDGQSRSSSSSKAAEAAGLPGPRSAFVPGQEADSRRELFNRISGVYDELNDRLSLGQHRLWKRMAVKWSGARPGARALDVCCGSGDLAMLLAAAVGPSGAVTGLDFAAEMLKDAARREAAAAAEAPWRRLAAVSWVQGDALELPFGDSSFDAATVGYGLRNVADIPRALAELRRVLVPGGRVAVLDFNNSSQPLVDGLQALLLEHVVVPAAAAYGLRDEYAYLRPSIKRFPPGPELMELALRAGFNKAAHYELGFGMMGVLVATR